MAALVALSFCSIRETGQVVSNLRDCGCHPRATCIYSVKIELLHLGFQAQRHGGCASYDLTIWIDTLVADLDPPGGINLAS